MGGGISTHKHYEEQISSRQRKNGHNHRKISPQTRHLARQIHILDSRSDWTQTGIHNEEDI